MLAVSVSEQTKLSIDPDNREYMVIVFLIDGNIHACCGYALEPPSLGDSNEYPQYMFLWETMENIGTFLLKKNALFGVVITIATDKATVVAVNHNVGQKHQYLVDTH